MSDELIAIFGLLALLLGAWLLGSRAEAPQEPRIHKINRLVKGIR